MAYDPRKDKIVIIYKDRKVPGTIKHDDFFKYVSLSMEKYFGENQEILIGYIKNLKGLSADKMKEVLRNILVIGLANQGGYIGVDWDRFFKQQKQELIDTSELTVDLLKKHHPEVLEAWDSALEKATKTQKNKDKSKDF